MNNQLNRRKFLRGLGTVIALPVFESLIPSRVWSAELKAPVGASPLFPRRLGFTYSPNGMDMSRWWPVGWSAENRITGPDYQMGEIMAPLKDYKKDILLISGMAQANGGPIDPLTGQNDAGGDHARATSTYLTGARPLKSQSVHIGISADQLLAKQIGDKTRFPSLELSCDAHGPTGKCDDAYSCSYQYNLSWRSATEPAPAEVNPSAVFEQLFGSGGPAGETEEAKVIRERYKKSVLDFVGDDAKQVNKSLGYSDRAKFDEYLTAVREIENRLAKGDQFKGAIPANLRDYGQDGGNPNGVATDQHGNPNPYFEDLARTMFDLQVLALQTDQTRIVTFSFGHDGQNRPYPQLGIPEGHHDLSHYRSQGGQVAKDKIAAINTYLMSLFAEFVGKLKAIPEGTGTLLDNCMLVYGSALSDSDKHQHTDLPVFILGNGGGAIKTGQHMDFGATSKTPMNNLYLALMEVMGVPNVEHFADATRPEHFGDATGKMTEILA